jgi:hypothetical protein
MVIGKKALLHPLIHARRILSSGKQWTTRAFARDAQGRSVMPRDPSAACFCAYGAIWLASPRLFAPDRAPLHVLGQLTIDDLLSFNDSHTHAEVLALFDAHIQGAKT